MKKVSRIKYSVSSVRDYLSGGQFYGLHKKGFTLIELIVVMAIVSILASLLVVNFSDVNKKGRDSKRKSDVQAMRTALELYRADEGSYPCGSPALPQTSGGAFVSPSDGTFEYMKKVPKDPRSDGDYYYEGEDADGNLVCSTYILIACLENKNDSDENIDTTVSVGGCTAQQAPYVVRNP